MMRRIGIAAALSVAVVAAAGTAKVGRASIEAMEQSIDRQISRLWPEDPFLLLGNTRGLYLDGYGAVFTSEINLVTAPGITPFHQSMSKDNVTDYHLKKLARLPQLREAMTQILAATASSLDAVPSEQKVVLGITLTHYSWEDRSGVPGQIVVAGQKGRLIAAKREGSDQLHAAVTIEEF